MGRSSGSPAGTGRADEEGERDLPANPARAAMIPSLHECSNILNSSAQVGGIAGTSETPTYNPLFTFSFVSRDLD